MRSIKTEQSADNTTGRNTMQCAQRPALSVVKSKASARPNISRQQAVAEAAKRTG